MNFGEALELGFRPIAQAADAPTFPASNRLRVVGVFDLAAFMIGRFSDLLDRALSRPPALTEAQRPMGPAFSCLIVTGAVMLTCQLGPVTRESV